MLQKDTLLLKKKIDDYIISDATRKAMMTEIKNPDVFIT